MMMCFRRRCHSVINIVMSMWMSEYVPEISHSSCSHDWMAIRPSQTLTQAQAGSHDYDSKMLTRPRAAFSVIMRSGRELRIYGQSKLNACHLNQIKINFFSKYFFRIFAMRHFQSSLNFALFSVRWLWISFQTQLAMTATSANNCDLQNGSSFVFISLLYCTCQECQVKLSNYPKHKLISIFSFSIEHNHHLFKLNAIWCKRRATNQKKKFESMRIHRLKRAAAHASERHWFEWK